MKFLLYGINYSPELTGIGKYSGEMAAWLSQEGHEVRVITAPPYYPEWQVKDGFSGNWFKTSQEDSVQVTRCPLYVPKVPSALKRILHLSSFAISSLLLMLKQTPWKPDVIFLVVPTLFCAPNALLLTKLTGAKVVIHIQDYEVDALFGLGLARGGVIKRFAFATERFLLNRFDRVSTISSGMLKRAREKGVPEDKCLFFPNWSEIKRFANVTRSEALLKRLGIDPSKKIILYSGNIGEKQGLEIIIDAAKSMLIHEDRVFLIVGEGAGKSRLVDAAQQMGLKNIHFAPLQPYEDLPALLASADCHLVIQKRGAADAVLPSKLTNIFAVSGNAVITADKDTSLGVLCQEFPSIAVRVEPESSEALIQGINECLALPMPNKVAGDYAAEFLDKDRILNQFVKEVDPNVVKR